MQACTATVDINPLPFSHATSLQPEVDRQAAFDINYSLGFVCVQLSMQTLAHHHYAKALELSPNHSDAHRGLAGEPRLPNWIT